MQTGGAVSLAALVFVDEAAHGLSTAISTFLIGSVLASIVCAARGSFSVVVAGAKNNVTVVLASVAASIMATTSGDVVNTTTAFVLVATAVSGLLLYLVGRLNLGGLVRYLPFPVMGGYLAGTAYLMFKGGLRVMTKGRFESFGLSDLVTWDLAQYWLPGIAVVVVFLFIKGATKQSLVLFAAIAGFHVLVAARGIRDQAQNEGWVLGPLPPTDGVSALLPSFRDVDWSIIATNAPGIGAVALIALVGLLLNITGVGYSIGEEYDINQELRAAGTASLAAGLAGGTVGFIGVGQTLLAHRLKATSALVSGSFLGIALVTVIAGPTIVGWMPRFVAGAMIMSPAATLLRRWWNDSVRVGSTGDRAIAIAIPVVVALVGVLEGVGLGVAAAAAIFVVRYAGIDPVRSQLSAATVRSANERPFHEQRILERRGGEIVIIEVVGFLFFGSVAKLTTRVHQAVDGGAKRCILDFRRVTGLDSSADAELAKLRRDCTDAGVACVVAAIAPDLAADVTAFEKSADPPARFSTIDEALEAAEQEVLSAYTAAGQGDTPATRELRAVLSDHLERCFIPAQTELITFGDDSDELFVIESGSCTVWAPEDGDQPRRIRRVMPGAFVGEMGFFTDQPRSATVTADVDLAAQRITRVAFDQLARDNPDAAMKLMRAVLALNSTRITSLNATVRDLWG